MSPFCRIEKESILTLSVFDDNRVAVNNKFSGHVNGVPTDVYVIDNHRLDLNEKIIKDTSIIFDKTGGRFSSERSAIVYIPDDTLKRIETWKRNASLLQRDTLMKELFVRAGEKMNPPQKISRGIMHRIYRGQIPESLYNF